jgi:hypothetical protein
MPTLTQPQIEMIARASGLPGDPKVWAAVAMAESSGNTTAKNPSSGAYGLWQIHPIHREDHPTWTEKWLADPVNNARAAAKVYSQQGWGAWEAYTNGSYKAHLKTPVTTGGTVTQADWEDWLKKLVPLGPGGLVAPEELGGTGTLDGAVDVAEGVGAVAEAVQKAGTWMSQPKNWARVAYVWVGGFAVLVGVYIIASPLMAKAATSSPVGQTVKKLAAGAKRAPARATAGKATGAPATTPKKED